MTMNVGSRPQITPQRNSAASKAQKRNLAFSARLQLGGEETNFYHYCDVTKRFFERNPSPESTEAHLKRAFGKDDFREMQEMVKNSPKELLVAIGVSHNQGFIKVGDRGLPGFLLKLFGTDNTLEAKFKPDNDSGVSLTRIVKEAINSRNNLRATSPTKIDNEAHQQLNILDLPF